MSATWQAFIASQTLDQQAQALADNAVYPLQQAFLHIQGADAAKFLQGQLSCDVRQLNLTHAGLGSHSTAKGRMLSSFRICQNAADSYLLRVHTTLTESASAALRKYIVFSKATLTIADNLAGIGLHGEQAKQRLMNLISELPDGDFGQCINNDLIVVCTSAVLNSYEVYGEPAALQSLWLSLAATLPAMDDKQHQLIEHQQGLAFVQQATVETFIPQMFNYQATPAISFKKGCYTGQEIVARMQYLGKLKRHLYHWQTDAETLNSGDTLLTEPGQQGCGHIASAVPIGGQRWDALLVLTDDAAEATQLFTEHGVLSNIRKIALPYTLERQQQT